MKKRVGELFGKPIVNGDANLVTKDEIYLSDLETLTLSVRDANGTLVTPGGGDNSGGGSEEATSDDFTESHTMFYWCQSSTGMEGAGSGDYNILIDLISKKAMIKKGGGVFAISPLPVKDSLFYWVKNNAMIDSEAPNIWINVSHSGRGRAILNSNNTPENGTSEYKIVSNPETMSNALDIRAMGFPTSNYGMSSDTNGNSTFPNVYNISGSYSDGAIINDYSASFYLMHDAWLITPEGEAIKIQEYTEPAIATYSLRDADKSYEDEPNKDYILELIAIKEVYAEEDAMKAEKTQTE